MPWDNIYDYRTSLFGKIEKDIIAYNICQTTKSLIFQVLLRRTNNDVKNIICEFTCIFMDDMSNFVTFCGIPPKSLKFDFEKIRNSA